MLYHYFPTKRDFFIAVAQTAAAEVGKLIEPDVNLSPRARLSAAISQFLAYAETHSHGFLTTYRGSLASDPSVRRVVSASRRRQEERVLSIVASGAEPSALLRLAVQGWLAFVQEVIAAWLEHRGASRLEVRDLLLRALTGVLDLPPDRSRQ